MVKRLLVLLVAVTLAAGGCSNNPGEDINAACIDSLEREQHEVGTRAVGEVARAAGLMDLALDKASDRRLQRSDERFLRTAQRRLEKLERKLDQAFNTGCM